MSLIHFFVFTFFLFFSLLSSAQNLDKALLPEGLQIPEGVQAKQMSEPMVLNGMTTSIYFLEAQKSELDLIETMKNFWADKKNNNNPPFLLKETNEWIILSRYDGSVLYTLQCQKNGVKGASLNKEGIFSVAYLKKKQIKNNTFNDVSFVSGRVLSESISEDDLKSVKVISFLDHKNKRTFTDSLLKKLYNNGWDLTNKMDNQDLYSMTAVKMNHSISIVFTDHLSSTLGVMVYEVYNGSKFD